LLVSARFPVRSLRDAFGCSTLGNEDGGTGERGVDVGLRDIAATGASHGNLKIKDNK
jgi:hypothetical protein